ncbi:MAG: hypothetical protein M3P49_02175 [Actinomycetota bacterium]|nr:hypothetical protein [Actinomycetota bacterium]
MTMNGKAITSRDLEASHLTLLADELGMDRNDLWEVTKRAYLRYFNMNPEVAPKTCKGCKNSYPFHNLWWRPLGRRGQKYEAERVSQGRADKTLFTAEIKEHVKLGMEQIFLTDAGVKRESTLSPYCMRCEIGKFLPPWATVEEIGWSIGSAPENVRKHRINDDPPAETSSKSGRSKGQDKVYMSVEEYRLVRQRRLNEAEDLLREKQRRPRKITTDYSDRYTD